MEQSGLRQETIKVAEAAIIALISNHRAEFDFLIAEEKKKLKGTK